MATFNPTDPTYDIPKITGVCAASNRPLAPGEKYFAVLLDPPPEARALAEDSEKQEDAPKLDNLGFIRRDVAMEAWDNGWRPPYLFSYWQSEVDIPGAKKKMFVDDTTLTQMLRDLDGVSEPSRVAFRYMVALILMRKKKLRFETIERRDDPGDGPVQEWWVFTPKEDPSKGHFGRWKEDEKITVQDPRLQESDAATVVEHLTDILGSDFANGTGGDKPEAKKEGE